MTTEPSSFIQAHRMIRQAALAPFRQWRLCLVVLLVTYLPLAVLWLGYEALLNYAFEAVYGAEDQFMDNGSDPVLAQLILSLIESPLSLVLLFGVTFYAFLVWGMAVWWRSQDGPITIKTPLRVVWWVGLIYLVPTVVSSLSAVPLFLMDFATDEFASDIPPEPVSLFLPNVLTFVSYWLIFRLAKALVDAAQDRSTPVMDAWRAGAADNKICLYIALDLTVLTLILDGISRFFQGISEARIDRALEAEEFDALSFSLLDTLTIAGDSLFITWLIFVELALIWSLAQRYTRDKKGATRP